LHWRHCQCAKRLQYERCCPIHSLVSQSIRQATCLYRRWDKQCIDMFAIPSNESEQDLISTVTMRDAFLNVQHILGGWHGFVSRCRYLWTLASRSWYRSTHACELHLVAASNPTQPRLSIETNIAHINNSSSIQNNATNDCTLIASLLVEEPFDIRLHKQHIPTDRTRNWNCRVDLE
jgi:hypothetical protein